MKFARDGTLLFKERIHLGEAMAMKADDGGRIGTKGRVARVTMRSWVAFAGFLLAVPADARASDYSHTCRVEGGKYVIADGVLHAAEKYRAGNEGEGIPYRVVSETSYSDEKGYCISWKEKSPSRYEFRARRYIQRIAIEEDGQAREFEARCALYGDGMPANLDCDRRVVLERVGTPERREKGWGIEDDREETISLWVHNGSEMELHVDEASWLIRYSKPRAELATSGVWPGTVLFDGQVDQQKLEGRSRIFTRQCGEISFPVRGAIERGGVRFVLRGKVPLMDKECRPRGMRESTLVFDAKSPGISSGGGSLPFAEAIEFAQADTALMTRVEALLREAHVDCSTLVCAGPALGDQWQHISRTRVPPFECPIGKHTLVLRGKVEFLNKRGDVVGSAEGATVDLRPDAFKTATRLRFVEPRWDVKD